VPSHPRRGPRPRQACRMLARAMERKIHDDEAFPVEPASAEATKEHELAAPTKMAKDSELPEYKGLATYFDEPVQHSSPEVARRGGEGGGGGSPKFEPDPASNLMPPPRRLSTGWAPVDVAKAPQPESQAGSDTPADGASAWIPPAALAGFFDGGNAAPAKINDPDAVIALLGELLRTERQRSIRVEERSEALAQELAEVRQEKHDVEKQLVRAETLLEAAAKPAKKA